MRMLDTGLERLREIVRGPLTEEEKEEFRLIVSRDQELTEPEQQLIELYIKAGELERELVKEAERLRETVEGTLLDLKTLQLLASAEARILDVTQNEEHLVLNSSWQVVAAARWVQMYVAAGFETIELLGLDLYAVCPNEGCINPHHIVPDRAKGLNRREKEIIEIARTGGFQLASVEGDLPF